MIYTGLNRTGEIETIKTHGGGEIAEVYGGINYQNPIFYSRKTLTGTSPLTFKGLGQPLKDYHIFGETVQDGTPSPDYPVDVRGCGEKTENLVDESKVTPNTYITSSGTIGSSAATNLTDYIDISATPFVISGVRTTGVQSWNSRGICFYDSNKDFIDGSPYSPDVMSKPIIVSTLPAGTKYVRFAYDKAFEDGIMLNIGTTSLPYEPYGYKIPVTIGNVTTPIYIGSEPLHRIGNYADEIDFGNQRIVRKIKKIVLNGTENWANNSNNSCCVLYPLSPMGHNTAYDPLIKCSHLPTAHEYDPDIYDGGMNYAIAFGARSADRICARNADYLLVERFKSWLASEYSAETPVTVLYVLEVPEIASVTLPALTAAIGDNTLSVDTTVKPSAVSITGNIKPTGYGQLLDVNDVDIQDSTGEPIYIQG